MVRNVLLAFGATAVIAGIVGLSVSTFSYILLIVGGVILLALAGALEWRSRQRRSSIKRMGNDSTPEDKRRDAAVRIKDSGRLHWEDTKFHGDGPAMDLDNVVDLDMKNTEFGLPATSPEASERPTSRRVFSRPDLPYLDNQPDDEVEPVVDEDASPPLDRP